MILSLFGFLVVGCVSKNVREADKLIGEADGFYKRARYYNFDKATLFDAMESIEKARELRDEKESVGAALKANEVILALKVPVTERDKREEKEAREGLLDVEMRILELRRSGIDDNILKGCANRFEEAGKAFIYNDYLKTNDIIKELDVGLIHMTGTYEKIKEVKNDIAFLEGVGVSRTNLGPIKEIVRKAEVELGERKYQEAEESIKLALRQITNQVKGTRDRLDKIDKIILQHANLGVPETDLKRLKIILEEAQEAFKSGDYEVAEKKLDKIIMDVKKLAPKGMVLVKGGCFKMGDTFGDGDLDENFVHDVCVDDFYIDRTEVTQARWKEVMGNSPAGFKGCNDCPVETVSWNDIQEFIRRLNDKTGLSYRLPTEAEWEYAARSGGKKEKWAGTSDESKLGEYAWYAKNSGGRTHPVGRKKPNGLGLYDMSGNVYEWVNDRYGSNYYRHSPEDNPKGPPTGKPRVLRGGSWGNGREYLRASYRIRFDPDRRDIYDGFRLSMSVK